MIISGGRSGKAEEEPGILLNVGSDKGEKKDLESLRIVFQSIIPRIYHIA